MRFALAIAAISAAATAGQAAEDHELETYGSVLFQCYADAEMSRERTACIGALSEACRAGEEGGETTIGIVTCALAEARGWDVLLNQEYKEMRDWSEQSDSVTAEQVPELATMADSLLQAQRAWIAFRDAECGLFYALWGTGSMRNVAASNCQMSMTAERTIALRGMRENP